MSPKPDTLINTFKKHKSKIVNGSGLAALIGSLTISGLQYQENSALTVALKDSQTALTIMSERYEKLVNLCLDKVDRHDASKR